MASDIIGIEEMYYEKGGLLFNNIAIATKYALARYELERILIVDFDVRYSNGTHSLP